MLKISLFSLVIFFSTHAAAFSPSSQIDIFSDDEKVQSIGTYTNGCLSGGIKLPIDGTGYHVMRLSRQRFYGHPHLIQFIQDLGNYTANHYANHLLIGDLGQVHGGRTPSGHRSHQNGLDVDIWFLLSTANILSEQERETVNATSMLANLNNISSKEWTPAHENILMRAAQFPEVERIFVNPVIKRELCKHTSLAHRSALQKIRPWWKHDDHFHVRLRCPKESKHCEHQEPLPSGDGCGEDLAWWFSFEATHPKEKLPVASEPPAIPELCKKILTRY